MLAERLERQAAALKDCVRKRLVDRNGDWAGLLVVDRRLGADTAGISSCLAAIGCGMEEINAGRGREHCAMTGTGDGYCQVTREERAQLFAHLHGRDT